MRKLIFLILNLNFRLFRCDSTLQRHSSLPLKGLIYTLPFLLFRHSHLTTYTLLNELGVAFSLIPQVTTSIPTILDPAVFTHTSISPFTTGCIYSSLHVLMYFLFGIFNHCTDDGALGALKQLSEVFNIHNFIYALVTLSIGFLIIYQHKVQSSHFNSFSIIQKIK